MQYLESYQVFIEIIQRLWLVLLVITLVMTISYFFRKTLGLYGKIYNSYTGMVGIFIVFFWILCALLAEQVSTHDPLQQFYQLKRSKVGAFDPETGVTFLLGGDNLGRDLFSRMIHGAKTVLIIAPAATLIAFMVGITLGLPAGFYGKKIDAILSFIANLILAFPVILLFYLLVTPGIRETFIPFAMAGVFFLFPIVFFTLVFYSRYKHRPLLLVLQFFITFTIGGWVYSSLVFGFDPFNVLLLEPNEMNIFAAVIFASSPGIFRIVRGLTMDIKTRDYIAAAQTRGEGAWYIMLWEMLPNVRGPLIVDLCLRIGYTAILLGTLGFFGLGLSPESSDWGSMINQTRKYIRIVPTMVLPATLALSSLILGLNLLADVLREQSLKD